MHFSRIFYKTRFVCLWLLVFVLMCGSGGQSAHANWYDGDDLGYLDLVTVNGTRYEDLDANEVVFYVGDLEANNGEVEITGILESEQKGLKPSDLKVQVSLNGGKSWNDATGDSRWSYTFRPTLERYYDLTIQVVRRDSGIVMSDDSSLGTLETGDRLTPYQLGAFVLSSGASVIGNKLTGEATLALGWLAQFVPENLKKPGTDELLLTVQELQVEGEAIVNGSVVFEPDFSFTYAGANFTLTNLTLTKDGASATGSMTLPSVILPSAPAITFSDLKFSPTAINYTLPLVTTTGPVQNFEIISGNYGVTLALSDLSVKINTAAEIPISLASLDGSIFLGSGYGGTTIPNLRLLENKLLSYGSAAVAQGALAKLTIPGTEFSLGNLGGSINLADKSVSISGSFNFPASLGGGSVSLPADKPLTLSSNGISTTGTLTFDTGTLPALDLSGFPTSLDSLDLSILNNIPSGSLAGQVTLTNFANVKLDVKADLDKTGISGLQMAAMPTGGTYTVDVGGFATLSLSKVAITYENSSFEVELDGSITPTNDLLTSIDGIGEQLVFTGLSISQDAIDLAADLEGWHGITGASASFDDATVQLSHYGLGVENNLFWVGLKGQASLNGSTADATARIFHNGTTRVDGIDVTNLYFAMGDFFLKVASADVPEVGALATGTQGYIGGLPLALTEALPVGILNDAGELAVQLEGFEVDLANRTVSLGSVGYTPATPFDVTLGPAVLTFTGLTFTNSSASLDGSISLAGLGLPVTDLPFSALTLGSVGMAGDIDLIGDAGTQSITVMDGDYGFGLKLTALSVSVDTNKALAEMVSLKTFAGSVVFGSGFDNLEIPDLELLASNAISWGKNTATEAQGAVALLTIPGTDFSLGDLGGSINLADKSLSISGSFNFPESLGGGSVSLPAANPLILSTTGISTDGTIIFDVGDLPTLALSGFPTSLTGLDLSILNNIPSGSLVGEVTLTNFAGVQLDVEADIDATGLSGLRVAALPEGGTRSVDVGGFATLSLSRVALTYIDSSFAVELDGAITPTNDLLTSINGIGDQLVFTGLSISKDAIALASDLEGWHDITGASVGFEGATVQLNQYGIGVDDNLFWVGLKGEASLAGSSATATAKIFHDGTTDIVGIDLTNMYFALGDFFLKVAGDEIDEAGAIANNTQGAIGGLPQILIDELPAGVLNDANELVVQLHGFKVDVANRSVSLGSVGYTPTVPLDVTLGPATLTFAGITFTNSSGSIDGSISLAGLGLPVSDLPFADLYLGTDGVAGSIDLIGDAGTRTITVMEGATGFSLSLDTLSVNVDTRKELANMVSLETFGGSLLFGSAYNDLEIPDLELLASKAISWGKNSTTAAQGSLARLTLPGGFAIGDLGGSIDLDAQSLSISGTIHLPAELNSASLTIPADQPITLSLATGLSTGGPLVFDPGNLPAIPLAGMDTIITGLSLRMSDNVISGSLEGDLDFKQFGGLKIGVSAAFDSTDGLQDIKIDAGNLNKTFNLEGFAELYLKGVTGGYKNDDFYVELDGTITPTHTLLADYQKKVSFAGLRVYKSAIEFAGDLGGWHNLSDSTININAASVSLKEYGLGVTGGLFWFGLKGHAEYAGNEADITAKIFHDKTYDYDFGFEGLTLALGDFKLSTTAELVDGVMSGAGSINAGFLMEYLPDNIKDPLTGAVNVSFKNLAVDLENLKVTDGTVILNFKKPLTPDLGVFSAVLRSLTFGFDGASVDGDFSLKSLAGIDIPTPPTNLSFADIEVSPTGFAGSVTYNAGASPVSLPVLTGDYGITLLLSELTVAVDTAAPELLDKLRLTDLDGAIELGSGYDMTENLTQLHMLADQGITWGVQAAELAEMGEGAVESAEKGAARLLAGLSFTIPGTEFQVNNINGRLYLNDKQLKVWGKVQLPANLGGGSIGLTETNALILSASGVSTTGEVDIDLGTIGSFGLAGFSATVQSFSFGVTSNTVSGSLAAKITLAKFDNIPIAVTASITNSGLHELTVVAEPPSSSLNLAGFADLTLTKIGGGYDDGEITVILDGDLALDPTVADVARTFSFSDLSISTSSITMPNLDSPVMFDATLPAFEVGDNLAQIALKKFGFTVKNNLMWLILDGSATILSQTVDGTILISHKGEIDLGTLRADDIVVEFGDFRLTGALALEDGSWSGTASLYLGALHSSLDPTTLNAFGELPVSVSDLDIDIEAGTLNSGTISFDPEGNFTISNDFFTASLPSVSVGVRSGSVFGEIGTGASISFDQGILAGYTDGLSFSGFGLANNGLQVTVTWADATGQTLTIVPHTTYGIDAHLTEVSVAFDSSKSTLAEMFVLDTIDGNLLFGTGYNAPDLKPDITFDSLTSLYSFDATGFSLTLVEGIKLENFSGGIDFETEEITFAGILKIPLSEGKDIDIAVEDWAISADGFAGGLAVTNLDLSAPLGFGAEGSGTILMKQAEIVFAGFGISSASLDLGVKLVQFQDLNIDASLGIDNAGAVDFAVDLETSANLSADVKFATLDVKNLGAGYDSTDGLYFSLDADVTMKQGGLLEGLPTDLTLGGIEVYAGKIEVNSAGVSTSFSGATASLGGVDLTLESLGLGYSTNKFYIQAAGNINVASLCQGDADITLYDDGSYQINEIGIAVNNAAMTLEGTLALYKDHQDYGTGFGASLDIVLGGSLPVSGSLMVGRKDITSGDTVTGSFVWWRAEMKVGSIIPLAPIPLNIYALGGGVGYNVRIEAIAGQDPVFIPNSSVGLSLTALVDMGTTDNGKAWFGKFGLTVEPADMRVVLTGDSWIMEGRNPTGTAHLAAVLELGGSPAVFHLAASIHVTKEAGGMDMVDVNGEVDVLFAANDWHVYFGSKEQPLSVTVLHYLGGEGYLQIDRSGLAMGVRKEFDLEGSAWIFYGRLYGGGEIDVEAGIQPFYVDARGKIWVGLEAGVKVSGSKYEIISAYAELEGRFKAPPVYIGLHGEARYSFLWGTISGTWDMTFTYPDDPPEGAGDGGIETVPLLAYSTPEQGATNVDRFTSLNIKTNVPINEPFQYEGDDWYMLTVDEYVDREKVVDSIDVSSVQSDLEVLGGLNSTLEVQYNPMDIYPPGQPITYEARLSLREWDYDSYSLGTTISQEVVEVTFDTSDDDPSFRERVYEVYPSRSTTPVYGDTDIYMISKAINDGEQWSWSFPFEKLSLQVVNARGERVAGTIRGNLVTTDGQEGSKRFLIQFKPDRSLQPVRMVQNNATGVKAPAIKLDDGSFQNPFTYVEGVAAHLGTGAVVSVAVGSADMQAQVGQTATTRAPAVAVAAHGRSASQYAVRQRALGTTTSSVRTVSRTRRVGQTTSSARTVGRTRRVAQTSPAADTQIAGQLTAEVDFEQPALDFEVVEPDYRWYWDGDYVIQVMKNVGDPERVFVSRFSIEVPPEGENSHPYGSTAEVVGESISDPHFYINYTVDQEAFSQDIGQARRDIVETGVRDIFWENMAREPESIPVTVYEYGPGRGKGRTVLGTHVEWREQAVCGQFDSPQDIGTEASGMFPSDWSNVQMLPLKIQWAIYMQAMRGCQSLEADIAVLEQQLNAYREDAFKRHSVADFRSLEFRFSTAAPINWSEVDMRIRVSPQFEDEEQAWGYSAWLWQSVKWASSHSFGTGEYIVRSETGSLDHRLELIPNGGDFDGQVLVGYLQYYRTANKRLLKFGSVRIKDRGLQSSNVVNDNGREFSVESGRDLYESGPITRLNSSRPGSSTRTDGLTYDGQAYSDGSN